jgi:AcrR family transcriptional regulator
MESTKQPEVTRAQILQAAFAEIHRHGFQAASINKILADTGLTKGALYHHFPTKQALGLAVVDEVIHRRIDERFCQPLRSSAKPLDALMEVLGSVAVSLPPEYVTLGCPLNNLMQEMSPLDAEFKEHLGRIVTLWKSSIEETLFRAREQGQIRPEVDCMAAALFIVSAWEGCRGVAKSLQSDEVFRSCMGQLRGYVEGLRPPG